MTRAVTIHDVARLAEVSIATVSNAMNRPARVSAPTRARVFDAADKLGYVPTITANSRAATARKRLGIVAPFSTYPSYAERLNGVLEVVGGERTEAIVFDHPSASRSPSPRLATLPFSGNLEGLIIMGIPIDAELAERILDRDLPTVLIDTGHPHFTSVVHDEADGSRQAAQHLIAQGYSAFVYITEGQLSQNYISQGSRRQSAFVRALIEQGIPESRIQLITARSGDIPAGQAAAEAISELTRDGRVGVLAGHDILAAGVIAGIRARHISVPRDVGVIGWDGGDIVEALGLTTVRQPLVESGRVGARALMRLVRGEQAPIDKVVLRPKLIEGLTT